MPPACKSGTERIPHGEVRAPIETSAHCAGVGKFVAGWPTQSGAISKTARCEDFAASSPTPKTIGKIRRSRPVRLRSARNFSCPHDRIRTGRKRATACRQPAAEAGFQRSFYIRNVRRPATPYELMRSAARRSRPTGKIIPAGATAPRAFFALTTARCRNLSHQARSWSPRDRARQ